MTTKTGAHSPAPMWTREGRADPQAWYRHMRATQPVAYHEEIEAYGVFRYQDVRDIYLDDVTWSVQKRFDKLPPDQRGLHIIDYTMNGLDRPDHTRLRNLAMPAFAPAQMRTLEARVQDITRELLDVVLSKGTFDLMNDFARLLPQIVINEILGVSEKDFERAKEITDRMEAASGRFTGAPFRNVAALRQVNLEYRELFSPIIAARRREDHGDVMSALVQAEALGDRLSTDELYKMAMIIDRAGAETTATGITNLIRAMLDFPDEYRRVRQDPGLIPAAVEEVLRYYPPSHANSRVAVSDAEIGGVRIPGESQVLVWLPSANRDPAAFPDPDRFDVGRTPNRHVTFGLGIHQCIGMHLARIEMQCVLAQWIERVETFRRAEDGPIEWSEVSLVTVFPRRFPIATTERARLRR